MKCSYCNKEIEPAPWSPCEKTGEVFCSAICQINWKSRKINWGEKQKHEEIKEKALKIYIANRPLIVDKSIPLQRILKNIWSEAEAFYNYAKEKEQEETNDDDS